VSTICLDEPQQSTATTPDLTYGSVAAAFAYILFQHFFDFLLLCIFFTKKLSFFPLIFGIVA